LTNTLRLETPHLSLIAATAQTGSSGWATWYFLLPMRGQPLAIGEGGFKGRPDEEGTVELSFSFLSETQHKDYACEAVRGLLSWAFNQPEVSRVIASLRSQAEPEALILEQCGFSQRPTVSANGATLFELSRPNSGDQQ